ncbi:hypothetical protein KC19_11G140300 [Ceratodon purpureus]|uniref:Uncharacterized protein n=1 Tax=Ceratodon purpureus TaxID=3225 RepID=A0A8T0GEU4_CERPU|nr:hypothetical protein KC19_11G140300 [Ceratodon purpureus]
MYITLERRFLYAAWGINGNWLLCEVTLMVHFRVLLVSQMVHLPSKCALINLLKTIPKTVYYLTTRLFSSKIDVKSLVTPVLSQNTLYLPHLSKSAKAGRMLDTLSQSHHIHYLAMFTPSPCLFNSAHDTVWQCCVQ